MSGPRTPAHDPSARGPDPRGRHTRGARALLAALLAGVAALALPASAAFGEGSVDVNIGPPGAPPPGNLRHALSVANASGAGVGRSPLNVYAQAGETVQMASSLMGFPGANIRIFAPGADPTTATPLLDCAASQPLSGRIASRAQELAGPLPNLGGYDACDFTVPADGIYTVVMYGTSSTNGHPGWVEFPNTAADQGFNASMWDVTVRDAGGAVQPGRLFAPKLQMRTGADLATASDVQGYVYTKTGYEYQVNFNDHAGINWIFTADDKGIIDSTTGDRIFASFACGNDEPGNNLCQFDDAEPAAQSGEEGASLTEQYPIFVNRVDPLAITGPGGLAETFGYSETPISPSSNPLSSLAFTGSGGQSGGTNRGSGGTIGFTSPPAMAELGYEIAIDLNRDGTFGNGPDIVDATGELSANGTNSFAWNGLDAQGNVPACGDYQYQIRSTLAEVHFTMVDVENMGGTRIERLTLPADASLGHPLAASYDNRDPYKNGYVVTNNPTPFATDAISGTGFNGWSANTGNTDYIDTWARLPEVQSTGTLRLLCADPQIVKSADPSPAVPGETLTFRLEVRNNGPDAATNVVATDDLPDSVTFESASEGCTEAGGVVTCGLASLAAGATHTFEITVAVSSSVDECIENTSTVTNSTPDTNPDNNTATICTPINIRANLSIAKAASTATVPPGGGQVMYTLVVRNQGPSDDPGVEVSDALAAGLTLVAAEPSQGTCTTTNNTVACDLGRLRNGGSAQVLVTVNTTATSGCIPNTARVRGAGVDPTPDDNQASAQVCVQPPPEPPSTFDLEVDKRASATRVWLGQRVTYTIVVRNNGPGAAPDARLTDTYNARATLVSVRTTQGSCTRSLPITCELGRIESGASATITVVIRPRETGRARNAASATSCCGTDTNPNNNMDTVDIRVRKVTLRLSKVASRELVRGGETFNYRIRVRNPTRGEARRVRVCDRLPSGVSYISSAPRARRSGRQQCWTINRLGARKSRTFRVTVRAARGATGRRTNTATVTSPDITRRLRARDTVRLLGQPTPVTG